jgi:NhaP-type Na+/H+ or K+/H+ antiporter
LIADVSSHGSVGLLIVAVVLLAYAGLSRRLATTVVSGPMIFVTLGVLVGSQGLDLVDFSLSSDLVRTVVEATLVLVLFSDASRIDLAGLRRHLALPGRLLGIGLPLTMVFGVGAAFLVYPDLALLELALIAVILAPTDAALGQAVVSNPRVPAWVRQGLNVESGLNDGIAVPLFTVLTAIAVAETTGGGLGVELVRQLSWGVVCGISVGLTGGWILQLTYRRGWISPAWIGIAGLLVAVIAYASAVSLGGSGFIAAFCAGIAFGHRTREELPDAGEFGEQAGQLLEAITFLIFGGAILTIALEHPSGHAILYAVLSLTIVRMVPVAIALLGSGSARPTVAFCGWFGPRGLASVLFLVLLVEDAPKLDHLPAVSAAVTWTVALSVLLHGITAVPFSDWYSAWYERRSQRADTAPIVEASRTHEHRVRRTERDLFSSRSDPEPGDPRANRRR